MFSMKHAKDMMGLLMRPWKVKPGIYHFKITKAITEPTVSRLLTQLRMVKNEKPQVLMLSINSGVGSFAQAQRAHDAFKQTSQDLQVPLHTFAEDVAIGVGYYLLSSGHKIHANPFSLIGDFSLHQRSFGFDQLLSQFNVKTQKLGSSLILDAFQKVTDANRTFIENHLQFELSELLTQVKLNRQATLEKYSPEYLSKNILTPNVFNAKQALENGLVDEICTFEEYRGQYYPNLKPKEISMEQDTSVQSIIQAKQEMKLALKIQYILNRAQQLNYSETLMQSETQNELFDLFQGMIKNEQDGMQVLSDVMANFVNEQMQMSGNGVL